MNWLRLARLMSRVFMQGFLYILMTSAGKDLVRHIARNGRQVKHTDLDR